MNQSKYYKSILMLVCYGASISKVLKHNKHKVSKRRVKKLLQKNNLWNVTIVSSKPYIY